MLGVASPPIWDARAHGEAEVEALPVNVRLSSKLCPVSGFSHTTFWRWTWVTLIRSPVERQHSFPKSS